jgi:adenine-specific DNA-methyltransferase
MILEIDKERSYKSEDIHSNLVIEGENSEVMAALLNEPFLLEGKINCMIWDPPYNTGRKDFLYKDKMSHADWLSFMEARLELGYKLLADSGCIALHIGYGELFHLGLLMDEIYGEANRIGIVNWECAYAPKNNNKGIPSSTDYVLIYAKNKSKMFRGLIPRTEQMEARYKNPDNDTKIWTPGNISGATWMSGDSPPPSHQPRLWLADNMSVQQKTESKSYYYGIENPFTGKIHFPPSGRKWRQNKNKIRESLCAWNIEYVIDEAGNCVVKEGEDRSKAQDIQDKGPWPKIYFGATGHNSPKLKRYRDDLRNEGRVLGTYWESCEILDEPFCIALRHESSGHNDSAKRLIKAILGDDIIFNTPKPLKLTERLVQLLCPTDGIVLDAFAGSATTAHAVLSLNNETTSRRFIMIEQGEFTDKITAERIRRVIAGNWVYPKSETEPLGGSFIYLKGLCTFRNERLNNEFTS